MNNGNKIKIGELNGKPIVQGDENVVTENELLLKDNSIYQRENGELKSILGGGGDDPTEQLVIQDIWASIDGQYPVRIETEYYEADDVLFYTISENTTSINIWGFNGKPEDVSEFNDNILIVSFSSNNIQNANPYMFIKYPIDHNGIKAKGLRIKFN